MLLNKSKNEFETNPMKRFTELPGEYKFTDKNGNPIDWDERKREEERLQKLAFDKCFPIGSVVKIGSKMVLIVYVDASGKMTKYKGCYYPQGVFSKRDLIEFSHNEINGLYYMGWWGSAMQVKAGFNK